MAQNDNRTERPTTRRLQKAREKGQTARSREVPAAAILLGGLMCLSYSGNRMLEGLQEQMSNFLRSRPPVDFTVSYITTLAQDVLWRLASLILPMM